MKTWYEDVNGGKNKKKDKDRLILTCTHYTRLHWLTASST